MITIIQNTVIGTNNDEAIANADIDSNYSVVYVYAEGGNDAIMLELEGSIQTFEVHGGAGNDTINIHSSYTDYIYGDDGDDRIYSSSENFTYGGSGDDTITISVLNVMQGSAGIADGGDGNDTILLIGDAPMSITGGAGRDIIIIGGGVSLIDASGFEEIGFRSESQVNHSLLADVDRIYSATGLGAEKTDYPISIRFLDGGFFNGSAIDADTTGTITTSIYGDIIDLSETTLDFTLIGDNGNDTLLGSDAANFIDGRNGHNTIYGRGGDDMIDLSTGSGSNYVDGEEGNDEIVVGRQKNTVFGGIGDDHISTNDQYMPQVSGTCYGGAGNDVFTFRAPLAQNFSCSGGEGYDTLEYTGKIPRSNAIIVEEIRTYSLDATASTINSFQNIIVDSSRFSIGILNGGYLDLKNMSASEKLKEVFISGSLEAERIDLSGIRHQYSWTIWTGGGKDTVNGSKHDDEIVSAADRDVIDGGGGNDQIDAGKGDDSLVGGSGNDQIDGDKGDDSLVGGSGQDTLTGGENHDFLHGGLGADLLKGGKGADVFLFAESLVPANVDRIADFDIDDDTIQLDKSVFTALKIGRLGEENLAFGKVADDANDHMIFDRSSGKLFYDEDGEDGKQQALIAILEIKRDIEASSFEIVS